MIPGAAMVSFRAYGRGEVRVLKWPITCPTLMCVVRTEFAGPLDTCRICRVWPAPSGFLGPLTVTVRSGSWPVLLEMG
jgi:hypothetical protein